MTIVLPEGSWVKKLVDLATGALGSKLLVYGLGVAAILFGARLWLNAHDDKVFRSGRSEGALGMKADLEKEYKIRQNAAEAATKQALADKQAAEARYGQVTKLFDQAFAQLREIKTAAEQREVIYVKESAAIPADELDDALRILSDDIAGKFAAEKPPR